MDIHSDSDDKSSHETPVIDSHEEPAIEASFGKKSDGGIKLVPQPSDDPRDPLNWPLAKKVRIFAVLCFAAFCGTASAVANLLATTVQSRDWEVTPNQAAYSLSANLAGIIVGPLIQLPLVHSFGVMSCSFWSQVAITIIGVWSAVSTGPSGYNSFIASRAIAGLFSVTAQIFVTGVIMDMFFLHQRGRAFAVYSTIYLISTVAGPTFSGYIIHYRAWPYVFWWTVAANGAASVLLFVFGEDTSWDRTTGKPTIATLPPQSWLRKRFWLFFPGHRTVAPGRGARISSSFAALGKIIVSPGTVLSGLYSLVCFGWYIMSIVQAPILLQDPVPAGYGFSPKGTATFFFSAWIGALLGVAYGFVFNDRIPQLLQKRSGQWKPEYHLHTTWGSWAIGPIGAGLYGAAAYYQLHYIVLAIGNGALVFGATACIPPTVNYVLDMFKSYPQEVGIAMNIYRVLFSLTIPFFYPVWVKQVGVNWVWGTAGFINVFGFILILLLLWKGRELRSRSLIQEKGDDEDAE